MLFQDRDIGRGATDQGWGCFLLFTGNRGPGFSRIFYRRGLHKFIRLEQKAGVQSIVGQGAHLVSLNPAEKLPKSRVKPSAARALPLSQTRTDINGLVGFANIDGRPIDVSGAPVDFTGSGWVWGGGALTGVTYFLTSSCFLDFSYAYAVTERHTYHYSSLFTNPHGADGTTITGTLDGISAGKVITQGLTLTVNLAF